MHRIRLLTLGMVSGAFVGAVLAMAGNFALGIVIAAAVLVAFAVAALLCRGPGWSEDDDDDRKSW
jgi:uncharacterized membrane protein YoaK (UPF0700 family)